MQLVFGVVFIGALWSMFFTVSQKEVEIIEVFGKFGGTKEAGLNFKLPFPISERKGYVSMKVMESKSTLNLVRSSDDAYLTIVVKVQYRIINNSKSIEAAFYNLDDPRSQMSSYIDNSVRSKAANLTLEQLYSNKNVFEKDAKEGLGEKFKDYGYEIVNVLIDDPRPDSAIISASNDVLAAEKRKDAAVALAEADRIELVGKAMAAKEALILKGEAFKEYRSLMADGNTEAMKLIMGTHRLVAEIVEKDVLNPQTGETERKSVEIQKLEPIENPLETNISPKDILDFFAGVDQRETLKDIGNSGSTTFIIPSNFNDGSISPTNIATMQTAMSNNKES